MAYEYKMVQIPPTIKVKAKEEKGNEAAIYLSNLVSQHAVEGWEYYRVDTIGVLTEPGCFASLTGAKQALLQHYVVTFRREKTL